MSATWYPITPPARLPTSSRLPTRPLPAIPGLQLPPLPPPPPIPPPPTTTTTPATTTSTIGPLLAAQLERVKRIDEQRATLSTAGPYAYGGPVNATGYVGAKNPPSLLGQAWGFTKSLPGGIAGFGKDIYETAAAPVRLPIDIARGDVSLTELGGPSPFGPSLPISPYAGERYAPAVYKQAESAQRTAMDIAHPSRFIEASREGTLFAKIVEDVTNASLAFGGASKALGRAPISVDVAGREAAAVAGETATRAVGAAPLSVSEALAPVMRTTMRERSTLQAIQDIIEPTARETVNFPGRGLAGVAYNAGRPELGAALARAGEITHRIGSLGQQAANAPAGIYTFIPRNLNRALQAVGGPDITALAHEGLGRVVERYGAEGGVLHPFTEAGREMSRLRSAAERQLVEGQRYVVEPAQLVNNLRLKTPLARAAAFVVDEMMFPTVHVLQQFEGRLDDAQVDQIIKEMYVDPVTGKPVSKSMRPTPEDVRVVLDYTQGRLEPGIKQQIDLVADSMGEIAKGRRDLLLRTVDERTGRPMLDVNQLGDELLPEIVSREDRVQEVARGRVQRTWEQKYPAMVRAAITASAYDALAAELPDVPRVAQVAQQGVRVGLRLGAESFARERFRTASRDLAQAVDDYQRLVEEGPDSRVKSAQNRVLRLTNRVNELRGDLGRVQRQESATTALSKVSGEVEPGAPRVLRRGERFFEGGAEGLVERKPTDVLTGQEVKGGQRPTPDLSTVEGVTTVRTAAKEAGQREAGQVFNEIENVIGNERLAAPPRPGERPKPGEPIPQLMGEEAIAARREAPRGEWDWWTEGQLSEATRKRLVREGWVSGRTRGSRTVRYLDEATGKIKSRKIKGEEYRGGVGPAELTRFINEYLGRDMSTDDAMAWYVGTIQRMWEAESGRSTAALERLSGEMGLPYHQVYAAVHGGLAEYRQALVDPVINDMNSLREGYVGLTQEERDVFDSVVDSILNDDARIREGTVAADLGDAVEMMMPEVNMTGTEGVLANFGNMVDVTDVVQWMRTGDASQTMRSVLAQRTPAGTLQLGSLRGQIGGLGDLVREVEGERRRAERDVAVADRAAGRDLAAAARRVDNAAEVEQGRRQAIEATGGVVDETPESIAARVRADMPARVREWERPPPEEAYATGPYGGPYTVEGTPYRQAVAESIKPSPGEVLRMRQGAAHKAYRDEAASVARLERSVAYRNRKIGDMRSELSRGVVDRLVEDVNHPWITRAQNIVRKGGEQLGRLRGPRDERYVDGLVGRLSRKYHVYDELVELLDSIQARHRSDLRLVDEEMMDPFGDPQPGPTETIAGAFEEVLREHPEIVMDSVDRQAFTDSVTVDGLLEDVNAAIADDAIRAARVGSRAPIVRNEAGETVRVEPYSQEFHAKVARAHRGGPNTPFRLRELIDHGMRDLPDDLKSQFRASWDDYQRRRSHLLNRNVDRYAEAMPARYRTLAFTARRQIRVLLDIAERENQQRHGSGDIYIEMATVTMDTLAEYVEAGVDPVHLIGGEDVAHPYSGGVSGRGRFAQRNLRAQYQRRTGLRTLDPSAQARVEADQLARVMHNILTQRIKRPFEEGGFGRRADDVLRTQIADHRARTGEAMAADDMAAAAEAAGWVSTEPRGQVNEQTMLIPDAIAKQSQDYSFTQWTAWQWLKSANKKWKSWVLPLSAKWLTGNVFGNVISAWAYAGINPIQLARTMLEIKRIEGGLAELRDRQGLPDWSDARLASHGLGWRDYRVMHEPEEGAPRTFTVPGFVPRVGGRTFRSPLGSLIEKSYNLNEFVDNLTRASVYLEKVRAGVPTDAAMKVALNAMGDFSRMSRFERTVVKELIPFYPWLRHQTQATLRLPIESPTRAAFLLHLADLYTDPEENAGLMEIIGSSVPLGGSSFLDIGSVSPFAETDPYRMPFSPTAIGRAITPAVRFPLSAFTGLDISRWEQNTRPAGTTRRGTYGQEEATPFWYTMLQGRPLQGLGELGYQFTQQVAPTQIRAARDIALGPNARYATGYEIGSETGRYLPANRGNLLNQILRAAGVPSVRHIDLAEARRRALEQERRQRG